MKEQVKTPGKELSNEKIANLSDAEFKTLVIRMLTEMVEYGHKIEEEVKAMQSGMKKIYTGNQEWREGNQDSNQQFGIEGRNKHSTRKNEETRIQKNEAERNIWDNFINIPTSES